MARSWVERVDVLPHVIPSRLPGHTEERVYPKTMLAGLATRQAVGRGSVPDSRANDLDLREVKMRAPAVRAPLHSVPHERKCERAMHSTAWARR